MIFTACFVFQAVDYELIALENGEKKYSLSATTKGNRY